MTNAITINRLIISLVKTYIAKRVLHTEGSIKEQLPFPIWENAQLLKDFSYPWLSERSPEMTFRALCDDQRFYFRFDVSASDVLTCRNTNHKMEVVDSDRVEIFFRTDSKLTPYYCLEMDPLGRVLDYKTRFYRQFEYTWQWPGVNQINVKAAITADGYSVEGHITLESLTRLNLLHNHEIQAGLFRGECIRLAAPESDFRWISWVCPDSPEPDFHIPSAFGMILLES